MSYFKRARKYNKPSVTLDEKIAKANQEFKKTGVLEYELYEDDLHEVRGMGTSGMYYADKEIPAIPAEYTPVPDPNGVTQPGFTPPTGGHDANDPSTWDNSFTDTDWLRNPNEVGGETNRQAVLGLPDSMRIAAQNSRGGAEQSVRYPDAAGEGGGFVIAGPYWGTGIGYLGKGGEWRQVLSGGLTGGTNMPHEGSRGYGGYYNGLTDEEFNNAVWFWEKYSELITKYGINNIPTVATSMWIPWSYFWHGSAGATYEEYPYTKRDGMVLAGASVVTEGNNYESSPYVPPWNQVIFQDDLGNANNLPIKPVDELLEELYDVTSGPLGDIAGPGYGPGDDPLDWADEDIPDENDPEVNPNDWDWSADAGGEGDVAWGKPKGPPGTDSKLPRGADINAVNYYNSSGTMGAKPEGWTDQDLQDYLNNRDQGFPQQSSTGNSDLGNIASNDPRGDSVPIDPTTGQPYPFGPSQFPGGNPQASTGGVNQTSPDGNSWSTGAQDTLVAGGPQLYGGGSFGTNTDGTVGAPEDSDWGRDIPDEDELMDLLGGTRASIGGVSDGDLIAAVNNAQMPQHVKDSIKRQYSGKDYSIEDKKNILNWQQRIRASRNNNLQVAHREPQGQVLTEKNHLRELRQKKREMVNMKQKTASNKAGGKLGKIKIEGPKDHLTMKAIDMLRNHYLTPKEKNEYAFRVGEINRWIREKPKEYAIWKVRYPKKDPRLAELNWQLDQKLRSSAMYLETRFPENQKLYGKLKKKIRINTDLTDPNKFKKEKAEIVYTKLLKVSKAIKTQNLGPL